MSAELPNIDSFSQPDSQKLNNAIQALKEVGCLNEGETLWDAIGRYERETKYSLKPEQRTRLYEALKAAGLMREDTDRLTAFRLAMIELNNKFKQFKKP